MIGHALCSEAVNQLRDGNREQANQTVQKVKRIIAEAEAIAGGAVLSQSAAGKLRELLADLKRLLAKIERSDDEH